MTGLRWIQPLSAVLTLMVLCAACRTGPALDAGTDRPPPRWAGASVTEGADGRSAVVDPAAYGPRDVDADVAGVRVAAGDDLQHVVDTSPPGTTFLLGSGIHRVASVQPKDGDVFMGEPGATLTGARELASFRRRTDAWVADVPVTTPAVAEGCDDGQSCSDVFIDDRTLRRVTELDELTPGTWYLDEDGDEILIKDDPRGRRVEVSVDPVAFDARGTVDDVTIRNLVVEKYAAPGDHGAIHAVGGDRWTIRGNEITRNRTAGIRLGDGEGTVVTGNTLHHNSRYGITAFNADDATVERNEIAYNNVGGFDPDWDAGGTKFVATDELVLRANYVHDNHGSGLWVDIDNVDTLIERNVVIGNDRTGIIFEISYGAVIRDNVVASNAAEGIYVSGSPDVEVYGNDVRNNAKQGIAGFFDPGRGGGPLGPYELRNLDVHDNHITMSSGTTGVEAVDVMSTDVWTSWNNRFHHNTYRVDDGRRFVWMGAQISAEAWRRLGNDRNGRWLPHE